MNVKNKFTKTEDISSWEEKRIGTESSKRIATCALEIPVWTFRKIYSELFSDGSNKYQQISVIVV